MNQSPTQNSNLTPADLPDSFVVSVIMESQPTDNRWVSEVWDAVGIVASSDSDDENTQREIKAVEHSQNKQLIYGGLRIRLYLDECESYYHNLMSPEPGCFIVARAEDEDGNETEVPIPILVTLSFDEAHAYLEGDATVYAVPIPPELYRWTEAFVVENYTAEKRRKRKRKDWKQDSSADLSETGA